MCSVMYLEWSKHSSCNVNMCRDSILHADVKCSLQGKSKFTFWKTGTIKNRCKIISTPVLSRVVHFVLILISFCFVHTPSHPLNGRF